MPDIVVTSYYTVMSDVVWFRQAFLWTYIVLDEGHRIKNDESKKAHLLDRVPAEYKLVVTFEELLCRMIFANCGLSSNGCTRRSSISPLSVNLTRRPL